MDVDYIIVQAGGKGTRMGYLTANKPKALVPIQNLPMIFHLFKKYPDKKYFIIGDYHYEVLERYLSAFAHVSYEMIDARGIKGTCAGVNQALKKIPNKKAFMLTWCDLILPSEYELPKETGNYIGISKGFQCRWKYENGVFAEEASVEHGVSGHFLFDGKDRLLDLPDEGEFVRWLCNKKMSFQEIPMYRTKEYGVLSEYDSLEKPKCRPFNRIVVNENRIIKEGIDEQGRKLGVREIAWYLKIQKMNFQNIPKIYSTNPLTMEKVDGKNIYEYNLTKDEKKNILEQLIACIEEIHKLEGCQADSESYYEAYIGKTFDRLQKVYDLVPFAKKSVIRINGKDCPNIFYHRADIETLVKKYEPKKFCLLHGDCTFSNMLLKDGNIPVMIDPRGYFGFTELYGDPAYDWVKLYYSIVGNYDQFNLKRFQLTIGENDVQLEVDSNHWEDMEDTFFEILGTRADREQIKILHAIVWLSLTTYAWEDYDSICGAFYNGLLYLADAL